MTLSSGLYNWRSGDPEPSPCNDPCVDIDDDRACSPLACQPDEEAWEQLGHSCPGETTNTTVNSLYKCYCYQQLFGWFDEKGFGGAFSAWFDLESACLTFAREWLLFTILPYVAPLAVVATNAILKIVITKMSRMEHHPSVSAEYTALCLKITVAQFLYDVACNNCAIAASLAAAH